VSRASLTLDDINNSLTLRWFTVGLLALLMAIPLKFIQFRVIERGNRADEARASVAAGWGGPQHVVGPVLVLPYSVESGPPLSDEATTPGVGVPASSRVEREGFLTLLPEQLNAEFDLVPQTRRRALFGSVVNAAAGDLRGSYSVPKHPPLPQGSRLVIQWSEAYVVVGISEPAAIGALGPMKVGSSSGEFEPGALHEPLTGPGFHARVPLSGPEDLNAFKLSLTVKGSGSFSLSPIGRTTAVELTSSWPHPDFHTSPDRRTIEDAGFTSSWSHSHLTQALPSQFDLSEAIDLRRKGTGVRLIEPVDRYSQVSRATKYGLLFVCMTFLLLLLFELGPGVRLHPVQYALVGVALALFYLTLLSLSEHIPFASAYLAAAAVVVTMVSSYIWTARRSWLSGTIVGAETGTLYAVLFGVLRMEDMALLAGTAVLLAATAVAMFATRNLGASVET